MEERAYNVGDSININYYKERKHGSTTYHPAKVMAVLPDGYLEIEFDSRRGKVEKIHEYDILTRQTRVCTMDLGENFYKEDNIDLKQTSKRHVFLSTVEYAVEEVLDNRTRGKQVEFLIKWLNKPPSDNMWQRRCMLSSAVQQEGDALIRRKLKIRTLEQKKKKKDKRIKKERKIKKEEE
jgi:hypothetical protein